MTFIAELGSGTRAGWYCCLGCIETHRHSAQSLGRYQGRRLRVRDAGVAFAARGRLHAHHSHAFLLERCNRIHDASPTDIHPQFQRASLFAIAVQVNGKSSPPVKVSGLDALDRRQRRLSELVMRGMRCDPTRDDLPPPPNVIIVIINNNNDEMSSSDLKSPQGQHPASTQNRPLTSWTRAVSAVRKMLPTL